MPNTSHKSELLLCQGKDCFKKQRKAYKNLVKKADKSGLAVRPISCQGSCAGPTVVVWVSGKRRWFEKLQSSKVQDDLVRLASEPSGRLSNRLERVELVGKKQRKAAKRLSKKKKDQVR